MTRDEFFVLAVVSALLIIGGVREYKHGNMTLAALLFCIPAAGWMSWLGKFAGWLQ